MPDLYHFWSAPAAQRVRLALGYKGVAWMDHPLDYGDDETFFELGTARHTPLLRLDDGTMLADSAAILWHIDELFPGTRPLVTGRIDHAAWDALLQWRDRMDAILERLYAPVRPGYRDIGGDAAGLAAYKAEIMRRLGMSIEELANDRYAGYGQLDAQTGLKKLARHLAASGFYMGGISIADMVLAADLYPLQLLDGVALPIDLMYYLGRVEDACSVSLREGMLADL